MQAKGLNENAPHTIGDAAQAYAAATLAGMSCSSSDWDALDSAAFRSCTPEPGVLLVCLSKYQLALDLHTSHISCQLLLEGSTGGGRTDIKARSRPQQLLQTTVQSLNTVHPLKRAWLW